MKQLIPFLGSLALVGCAATFNSGGSSDYGCPGMPQGVVCKTPATVYKMSNGDIAPTEFDTPPGTASNGSAPGDSSKKGAQPVQKEVIISTGSPLGGPPPLMPLREPPKMMRIWFAPWIDKNDAWHSPSYQVVEVQSRKWATGKMEVQSSPIVTPYVSQVQGPQTDATKTTGTAANKNPSPLARQAPNGGVDLNSGLPVQGR